MATLTFKQFLNKQTTKTISSLYSFITAQYEWGFEYHFKQLPDLSKKFAQYGIEWSVDGLKAISDFKKKIIANLMTARNKEHAKKDLGLIAMMSGAYVAQIAIGANQAQAVRAFREAEAFNGPSIILAYAPCIAHGFALQNGVEHQINLVNTGAWPLYRFNPSNIENGQNPLKINVSSV